MTAKTRVLVVEDEKAIGTLLGTMLDRLGHQCALFQDAESAWEALEQGHFDLVITDLRLPKESGEELLVRVKRRFPTLPVVVISGYGNTRNIVEVIQKGAEDYLAKPFTADDLEVVILKVLKKQRLLAENEKLRSEMLGRSGLWVSHSLAMNRVLGALRKFAAAESNVLIQGESGVGKSLAAQVLHGFSARSRHPFRTISPEGMAPKVLEAELFGAKRGTVPQLRAGHPGLLRETGRGSLLLEEVPEIPPEIQARFLRVLESGEARAIGEAKGWKLGARILSTSQKDMRKLVVQGKFREDLFQRLSVLVLTIPPLRERREDIPVLADHFLGQFAREGEAKRLTVVAQRWLMGQDWPGNVRELRNALERAATLATGPRIGLEELRATRTDGFQGGRGPFRQAKRAYLEGFERDYLRQALQESQGNVSEAARRSGLARRNFQALVRKYKLRAKGGPGPGRGV